MAEPPEQIIEASRASTLVHDAIAGFDFACILAMTFFKPLEASGKISLCLFSISLPSMIVSRIGYWHIRRQKPVLGKLHVFVEVLTGQLMAIVGFFFLLWRIYWLAAVTFSGAVVVCVAILYWGMVKQRGRR